MPNFDFFRPELFIRDELLVLTEECTPRILIVTDGLSMGTGGFGLSEFAAALKNSKVHGITPHVTTANTGSDNDADLPNFNFVTGLEAVYDVMFLFAFDRANAGAPGTGGNLSQTDLDAIAAFMDAGKGVFATGDHEDLGAAMCGNLPRVRQMRLWYFDHANPAAPGNAPHVSSTARHTTNSPGADGVFEFEDQSDEIPQKIYPRYYAVTDDDGNTIASLPHALLQAPGISGSGQSWFPIEVAPDHPHEGDVVEPPTLVKTATIGSLTIDEWPDALAGGDRPAPEIVAYGVNYGGYFPSGPTGAKEPIHTPELFGVVGTYDGHQAGVGRVVVDSTWHHYININIDGAGSSRHGLKPGGTASPALQQLYAFWQNLAEWMMPEKTRRCLLLPWTLELIKRYPLWEELPPLPWPPLEKDADDQFEAVGNRVIAEIRRALPPARAEVVIDELASLAGRPQLSGRLAWVDAISLGAVATMLRAELTDGEGVAKGIEKDAMHKRITNEVTELAQHALRIRRERQLRIPRRMKELDEALKLKR